MRSLHAPLAAACLALLLALASPAEAVVLRCGVTEKWICQMGAACQSHVQLRLPINTWATYDTDQKVYARCDPKGCDPYRVSEALSGVFTNLEIPGKAAFAKIGPDGVFVEVVSQITGVWISYGRCAVAGLP